MASKSDYIALEAVRQFKNGELFAWVNDERESARSFGKCLRAISRVRQTEEMTALGTLELRARTAPRKKEIDREALRLEDSRGDAGRRSKMIFSLVPIGSNQIEFRAILNVYWRELYRIAQSYYEENPIKNTVDDRTWQWIDVNTGIGFTGTFHLTYADGVLFGQVVVHDFSDEAKLKLLSYQIAEVVRARLQLR